MRLSQQRIHRRFRDRIDAGRHLAARLAPYAGRDDVTVLALPRGGVPVGYEVARALHAPLDVFIVRKLGVPGHEEYAMGAVASGGTRILNDEVVRYLRIGADAVERASRRARAEIDRRERAYRGDHGPAPVQGRTVIVVDDGIATGATIRVASRALRERRPEQIVIATPVASPDTLALLRREVDDVVCVSTPDPLHSVGLWYVDFAQTSDEEVVHLLQRASRERTRTNASHTGGAAPAASPA